MPSVVALLTAILGIAINFATDLKTDWVAWLVVVVLIVAVTAATVIAEQRRRESTLPQGTVLTSASAADRTSITSGLVLRRSQTTAADGSVTTVIDYFSEELALQSLREASNDTDRRE